MTSLQHGEGPRFESGWEYFWALMGHRLPVVPGSTPTQRIFRLAGFRDPTRAVRGVQGALDPARGPHSTATALHAVSEAGSGGWRRVVSRGIDLLILSFLCAWHSSHQETPLQFPVAEPLPDCPRASKGICHRRSQVRFPPSALCPTQAVREMKGPLASLVAPMGSTGHGHRAPWTSTL